MNRPIHRAETRALDPPLKNRYQLSNQVDSDLSSGRHVKLRYQTKAEIRIHFALVTRSGSDNPQIENWPDFVQHSQSGEVRWKTNGNHIV